MASIVIKVASLPGTPVDGFEYFLTTAATVYPAGRYIYDGSGWICTTQAENIALSNWTATALSLTLVPGVTYTVEATAAPTSFAVDLETIGTAMIIKTGAFAVPDPTTGSKLTDTGLDALAETTNDVQIIIEKIGSSIIYSAAEIIAI